MKTYTIAKTNGAPDWDKIEALAVDTVCWLPDCGIAMEQKLCYDDGAIYVWQRAHEQKIRATLTEPLDPVCEDSCMEFFFGFADDGRYFNFECNPNGCIYLGFGASRAERVRLIVEDPTARFSIRTAREVDGWSLTYRLPLSFLRQFYPALTLESGLCFRANCYKCGDCTEHAHYLSWNPMSTPTPDYHRPIDFGTMVLA